MKNPAPRYDGRAAGGHGTEHSGSPAVPSAGELFGDEALERLKRPIVLDGYKIKAPEVSLLKRLPEGQGKLQVVIHEGRNRQVRRMCAAAGMQVKRLVRTKEGRVSLGSLPSGKWRYLTQEELAELL
jgi:23S rRNA pseudouridine2605 synthase